jgi:hypothetical protein
MFCGVEFDKEYNLEEIGITQSMIKTYLTCPAKFLFKAKRWYLPGGDNRTTSFGTMFHHIIEKVYNWYKVTGETPDNGTVSVWLDLFINSEDNDISGKSSLEVQIDALIVEVLIEEYVKQYKNDFKKSKVLFVERPVVVVIDGIKYRMKIDLGLQFDGFNYTLDHKTSSRINENAMPKMLSFDFQHQIYTMGVEAADKIKINGSYHNVIRRPETRAKITQDDFDDYRKKLKGDIRKNPSHYFKRYIISYTEEDKAKFKKELGVIMKQIRYSIDNNEVYRNSTRCLDFSACQFLEACSSESIAGYAQADTLFKELGDGYAVSFKNKTRRPRC